MDASKFRVLPGLPGDGPWPIGFSPNGRGHYREGYVIQFQSSPSASWVGNFQGGFGSLNAIVEHSYTGYVLVTSRGQGYLVDPNSQELIRLLAPDIALVIPIETRNEILVATYTRLEVIDPEGLIWNSPRVSWDGIKDLRVSGSSVTGEAWSPVNDSWSAFRLDLNSRVVEGASYPH